MIGDKVKSIFDKYVAIMINGGSVHRYTLEEEFEQMNKRYKDPQSVELLLKKAAEGNSKYRRLFDALYGGMPKHGGGGFRL